MSGGRYHWAGARSICPVKARVGAADGYTFLHRVNGHALLKATRLHYTHEGVMTPSRSEVSQAHCR